MRSPGVLWIKAAVVYLVMGVGLGIYMGASGDHVMVPVHAHFNLLGWASLALVGLIYHQFPPRGLAVWRPFSFGSTTSVYSQQWPCWSVLCVATPGWIRFSGSLP